MTSSTTASTVESCRRCQAQIEHGDLRCPVCALPLSPSTSRASTSSEAAMQVLRCVGCGAAMAWSAEKQAVSCAFCGAETKLERIDDPVEQTEAWVPFRVDEAEAKAALSRWLKTRGFFVPGDLAQQSVVDDLKPVSYPAWVFDARAHITWAADSNAGSGRSDWAPHAGELDERFDRIVIAASRGLTDDETRALGPGTDIGRSEPTPPSLPGILVEAFDVQRSAARGRVADAIEGLATAVVKEGHIPGNRFRNIKVAVVVEQLFTRRLGLPAWILAYRYRGRLFRVVIHGQDSARVLGKAPLSGWRIAAVVVGGVLVLAGIAALIALLARR